MGLQIDTWPMRGLHLTGTLHNERDVARLFEAMEKYPEGDLALHMESLATMHPDAAQGLVQGLKERARLSRAVRLHVVPGAIADAIVEAGFEERVGELELIFMTPQS